MVDLKSIMNQFDIFKIYTIFTQQEDRNSIQVPIDCKLGDTGPRPRTRAGTEISWSTGIAVIHGVSSYYCGIMLEINIKVFEKTHLLQANCDIYQETSLTSPSKAWIKLGDWKTTEGNCRGESIEMRN